MTSSKLRKKRVYNTNVEANIKWAAVYSCDFYVKVNISKSNLRQFKVFFCKPFKFSTHTKSRSHTSYTLSERDWTVGGIILD